MFCSWNAQEMQIETGNILVSWTHKVLVIVLVHTVIQFVPILQFILIRYKNEDSAVEWLISSIYDCMCAYMPWIMSKNCIVTPGIPTFKESFVSPTLYLPCCSWRKKIHRLKLPMKNTYFACRFTKIIVLMYPMKMQLKIFYSFLFVLLFTMYKKNFELSHFPCPQPIMSKSAEKNLYQILVSIFFLES